MQVIAAGSFGTNFGMFGWAGDGDHPMGSAPFNISGIRKLDTGVYLIYFSVLTDREGLQEYHWFVTGNYCNSQIEWLQPKRTIVRFFDTISGVPADPSQWSIIVARSVPNGNSALNGLTVIQSFDPDGVIVPIPENPFGVTQAKGVSQNAVFASQYNISTLADISTAGCANIIIYEPQPQERLSILFDFWNGAPWRSPYVGFSTVPGGVWTKVLGNWTYMVYCFSDDSPTSIFMESKYLPTCPAPYPPNGWDGDTDATAMAAGTYSLSTPPNHYTTNDVEMFVYGNYPAGWGRPSTVGRLSTSAVTWSSSDLNVVAPGTVQDNVAGRLKLVAPGTADIRAHFRGLSSPPVTITVVP